MQQTYGNRVNNVYLFQSLGLLVCSIAVQLLAGAKILALVTGLPFLWATIVLVLIAMSYSMLYGLSASIITDFIKINAILIIGFTLIPWTIVNGGGLAIIGKGFMGYSEKYSSLFNSDGVAVFLSFGLPATIGLLSGPFGDQAFWQRAFAIREKSVQKAFIFGAFIFALVPLLMSCLGFMAAGLKMLPKDIQFVNLEVISQLLPAWTLLPFVGMVMCGLISAIDSHMTAISSVGGHDINLRLTHTERKKSDKNAIKWARIAIIIIAITAIIIANIPGIKIEYLFLFYGTLRASTLLPTVITLLRKKPAHEGSIYWGIIISICVGLPIFSYGNFTQTVLYVVVGSLITLLASGVIVFVSTFFILDNKRANKF